MPTDITGPRAEWGREERREGTGSSQAGPPSSVSLASPSLLPAPKDGANVLGQPAIIFAALGFLPSSLSTGASMAAVTRLSQTGTRGL